jgi:hypothetical protein
MSTTITTVIMIILILVSSPPRPPIIIMIITNLVFTPSLDEDPRLEQKYPREVLGHTPKFFDLLFSLLSRAPAIVRDVWELIGKLPVNRVISDRLTTLDGLVGGRLRH